MSGHSKWSTIKRAKGVADIKRGMTFTKIANMIALAARAGGSGDPQSNPRLRVVLESAKRSNMPKENIQRAIDRGLGKLPGQVLEEIIYEGFGPGKAAFIIEGITDNRNRTNSEVRNIFEKSGGNLGGQGSTSYMFSKKGEVKVKGKSGNKDDEMLELIDLGSEDVEEFVEDNIQKYLVYVESPELNTMGNKITQAGFEVEESEVIMKPTITVEVADKQTAGRLIELSQKLEDLDDIQKVYANFDIKEEII